MIVLFDVRSNGACVRCVRCADVRARDVDNVRRCNGRCVCADDWRCDDGVRATMYARARER